MLNGFAVEKMRCGRLHMTGARPQVRSAQSESLHTVTRRSNLDTPMPDEVMEFLNSKPEGSYKFATILADKTRQLLALDRYERRALSRRKLPFELSMWRTAAS